MHTATGINHLFTNTIMNNVEIKTAIVKTDISDHFLIIFVTKRKIDAEFQSNAFLKVIFQTSPSINLSKNYAILIEAISKFYKILMMRIVNFSSFFSLCNECFPKFNVKLKPQKQFNHWITNDIRNVSKKKQKLYEKLLKERIKQSETKYKVYKNMFKHKSKKSYYFRKIIKCKDNSKK